MTVKECCAEATRKLQTIYPASESLWMVRIIFEHLKGYKPVDLVIKADDELSNFITGKVDSVVERLLRHEPIQYIFGETTFYGLRLEVTPDTLIPRPETEELVDMIVHNADNRTDLGVLDICTGSGCIAIALARNLRFPKVEAIDISSPALDVARRNASALKIDIDIKKADALHLPENASPAYNIIVSNPPYIAISERATMDKNVLDYEPSIALFVPDNDPLLFYRNISRFAIKALHPQGRLYFEINPIYAEDLRDMLTVDGWDSVEIILDMQRNKRFTSAISPLS